MTDPVVTLDEVEALAHIGTWSFCADTGVFRGSLELRRIYGVDDRGANGGFFVHAIHPEDRDAVRAAAQAALATGEPFDRKHRVVRPDGSVRVVRARGRPVLDPGTGRGIGLIGTSEDVTDPEAAAAALEARTREIERSNRELEQFAYVASHDLREPVRVVKGYLDLLGRRSGGALDDRARGYLDQARSGAERMEALIGGLLQYARIGTKAREPASVSADAALDEALANLRLAIDESGGLVTRDALPCVLADRTQLVQVLQNLVSNGLKFRGARPARVHVSSRTVDGASVEISVRDDGIGIDPREAQRLFVPFQRLVTQDEVPGTGIGLALCKRVVERHGGTIGVESRPGQGATFRFTLPASERAPPRPQPGRRLRVLLVDDVAALRALIRELLEESGRFEVVAEAADGIGGTQAATSHDPDLVLLDVSMPRMDGLEALPHIRRAAPRARVVLFSGFQEERLAAAGAERGAVGYIEKGTPPGEMVERLLALAEER